MGSKLKATDHASLSKFIGEEYRRTIGHQTVAVRESDGSILVYLFGNQIARLFADGRVAFTLAGWPTVTTRDRLNQLLPPRWGVCQIKGEQYAYDRLGEWKRYPIGWSRVYVVSQDPSELLDTGSRALWLLDRRLPLAIRRRNAMEMGR